MERRSEKTKALLGEEFKELVVEKSFEKITIKMITDAAGVIRPTFYNYFQDKYEVMEWLLWENVFQSVTELISMDMENLRRGSATDRKASSESGRGRAHHQRGDILKIPVYHFGQWDQILAAV